MLVDATDPTHLVNVNQTNFPTNFSPKGDLRIFEGRFAVSIAEQKDGLIALSLPTFATIWKQTGPVNLEHQLIVYGPRMNCLAPGAT